MSGNNASSSDEESNFQSNFNVPAVNLANLRKKEGKGSTLNTTRANIARATKKLSQGTKTVRFPDNTPCSDSYRGTTVSSILSVNGRDLDNDLSPTNSLQNEPLPSFRLNIPDEDDYDSDSDSESYAIAQMEHPITEYNEDSSGDEQELVSSRKSSLSSLPYEVDLSDVRRGSQSNSASRKSTDENDSKGFRDIFRKMSLAERVHGEEAPSRSDTFLGKILNFAGAGAGGLAPGASLQSGEKLDEEKEIAPQEDNAIELKPLDYFDHNEEAQNLISAHVASHHVPRQKRISSDPESDLNNGSSSNLVSNEKPVFSSDQRADHLRTMTNTSGETFFQPNPDFLFEDPRDEVVNEDFFDNDGFVAPPKHVHAGVLSSLLKLYQNSDNRSSATFGSSINGSTLASESVFDSDINPRPTAHRDFLAFKAHLKHGHQKLSGVWKHKDNDKKDPCFGMDDEIGELEGEACQLPSFQNARPKAPKAPKTGKKIGKRFKKRENQKLRITVHIADILQRQRFIIRMCKALMMYGAPTHRLEEYMIMTSRVLEIDGQFVYFPGTMIIAFGDAATRTSEVHLVKCAQGLNLCKLSDTHKIYKEVVHDLSGVEEASIKLDDLIREDNIYSPWTCVFLYGLGSATVCAWGFGGGWYDVPVTFGVGLIIGYLQFFLSPKSHLYSSVFEVAASIVVSFIARALGSIRGGNIFCFGAIAQGALALILPGYIILCGSLELQSKNLVAGSVRMFYAIIYSLFLGFGITLGAALYGWVDHNATDQAVCPAEHSLNDKWKILFVPMFSICLSLINQARLSQLPVMTAITAISYVATFFSGKHFADVTEFTAAIGAFIIGILGNVYSRLGRGMAVSAMLPAIFVQVPSGIASKGSLLAGVDTANKITNSSSVDATSDISSLTFGVTMVEVSIGICVGLCAAALVIYPFGKQRTSLFTL